MTTDLLYLTWSAVLCVALTVPVLIGRIQVEGGLSWAFGNRDRALGVRSWVHRAERAHANLVENLAPFAALVLVAHVSGEASELTAAGAATFFYARLAHPIVYMLGLVYVRTAIFFVGIGGDALILAEILR